MSYCIYLRKSRADKELCSEEEVLKRHETTLLELAKNRSYNITKIFREVVSGETLAARPQMQELLSEVENGLWEGVLVMEVERLARGNSVDQGIVSQAFKYSNTLIITPTKTYNPANEFDEEYFEFGLFMSRREYKTINRRLNAGRIAACKEGKYRSVILYRETEPSRICHRLKINQSQNCRNQIRNQNAKKDRNDFHHASSENIANNYHYYCS